MNFVSTSLDERNYVVAVFIDLRKAFDVVDHGILLNKLDIMGIRGKALSLLKTYLSERKQYVSMDGVGSGTCTVACGVPQGSVLGPALYSLHVRSLESAKLRARYFVYADDTILVYKGKDLKTLENDINNDLGRYLSWLVTNKLQINIVKTNYMVMMQKNMLNTELQLKIGENKISRVSYAKYLGLVLDDRLTWSNHIEYIEKKLIPMIGALFRCRNYLSRDSLYQIYNAYFLSNMRYLIVVWGTCGKTLLEKAQKLQNKVIKVLFNFPFRTSSDTVYKDTGLLKITQILELEQSKFMYKVLNKGQKCNVDLRLTNSVHTYNIRNNENVFMDSIRTNIALNNPITQCKKTYNNLSESTKKVKTVHKLKKLVTKEMMHRDDD